MAEIINIKDRMTPDWITKGKAVWNKLSEEDTVSITAFVFNLVLADVQMGVDGQEHEVFFERVNRIYQAAHAHCYFSDLIDGNETAYTGQLCPLCAVKVRNILSTGKV